MLSTQYRLRVEAICEKIVKGESVELMDMIWIEKLAKKPKAPYSKMQFMLTNTNISEWAEYAF